MKTRVKVLVVDDSVDAADSMALVLTLWGYGARACYDGAAALGAVADYRPDAVLLDIGMPEMDGFEVAERVREQRRSRSFVLIGLTGYGGEWYSARARGLGFDHYLLKPVEPKLLQGLLARITRVTSDGEVGDMDRAEAENLGAHSQGRGDGEGDPGRGPPLCGSYGVLVVDDQECIRGVLEVGLRGQGAAVWLAAGGREAVGVYRDRQQDIDVVLLDVCMPGLDGPHTLVELRKLNPRVRCCFMSGDLGGYTERELRTLGGAAVFHKPFQLPDVARVLSQQAVHARRSLVCL
jgi:CheY-like chemotaxis protein